RETKQEDIGPLNIQIGYSLEASSRPLLKLPTSEPGDENKTFSAQGWCYQVALKKGYGVYCHSLEKACQNSIVRSDMASPCVFIKDLSLRLWGGKPPEHAGYLGPWYRVDLPQPLPAPFPQPPSSRSRSTQMQYAK